MWQREKFAFIKSCVMRPEVRMERLLGAPWMSGGNMLPLQVHLFDKKKLRKAQEVAGLKPS